MTLSDELEPLTRPTSQEADTRALGAWHPQSGDWINGTYHLGPVLGAGGLGIVFRAHDVSLGREVAIKLLRPDHAAHPVLEKRLLDEARAMASTEHPRLVTAYAWDSYRGAPFVVMELVEGISALARLRECGGRLVSSEVLHIAAAVAEGLDWLHASGLDHGDVKPANVVLGPRGAVRLVDSGTTGGDPASTEFTGTPAYAAPERLLREPVTDCGRSSDVYSLAVTAFELFTGTLPFPGRGAPGLTREALCAPPPLASARRSGLSPRLDAALAAGLAREASDRPASAGAFVASLRAAISSSSLLPRVDGGASSHAPRRVLLVDADADLTNGLARKIVGCIPRCTVEAVADRDDALSAAASHPPDAVVVDVGVSAAADAAFVRAIQSVRGGHDALVVIALTASGGASDWRTLRDLGATRCYLKPVEHEDVLGALVRAWHH